MLNFNLKVERKLYFPESSLILMETFLVFAGRTFFLLLLCANWTSPGVFPRIPFRTSDLICGIRAAFCALTWRKWTAAKWSGAGKSQKKAACVCVSERERERTWEREGAREGAALPRCWVPGCRPLRQHGLRVTEAGRARGQQPREDLLHAKEGTSGDQNGQRVRVRAAGLQFGR